MSVALSAAPVLPGAQDRVEFARDVWPLLERCQSCHGASLQMNGLRLDRRDAAIRGGSSGPAVVPGNGQQSLLIQMVSGQKPGKVMPPAGERLTEAQILLLKAWIDQGAEWPEGVTSKGADPGKHWSYRKPLRSPPPRVKELTWVQNPIDNFILARLEKEGLAPAPEASKESLVRRLSLDLVGLPPPPDVVDQFLADKSPDAYPRLVDRLLASPHFGEHWAQQWLDFARYADTNGYESDEPRSIWAWRDWVIDAFNRNLPFDRFSIEQLAGDLLPNPSPNQLIATGFHRNTLINDEAGVKDDEFYDAAVKDRVDTTATVWLGSTLGCAQCHNHKYDPFTQRDYYQLYAVFNNTAESAISLNAQMRVFKGDKKELDRRRAEIDRLKRILDRPSPELAAAQRTWETRMKAKLPALSRAWRLLQPSAQRSFGGANLKAELDGSTLASGNNPDKDTYELEMRTSLKNITGFRLEALPHESLPGGGPGRGEKGNFALSGVEVEAWTEEQLRQQALYRQQAPQWEPWHEIGPFRVLSRDEAFSKVFEPENNYDLLEVYENGNLAWNKRPDWEDGVIRTLEGENCARYLYRAVSVSEAVPVWVSLGTTKGVQVWLNHTKILSKDPTRQIAPDQEWMRLQLRPGRNEILIKLTNDTGKFGFYFRPYLGLEREARIPLISAVAEYGDSNRDLAGLLDGDANSAWFFDHNQENHPVNLQAIFQTKEPIGSGEVLTLKVRLKHESTRKQHTIGRFRLWATTLPSLMLAELVGTPLKIRGILAMSPAQRSLEQRRELAAYYRSVAPALSGVRQRYRTLTRQLEEFQEKYSTTTLVLRELPKARETHIQNRGNFLSLGERVAPGTPKILHPIKGDGKEFNRLSFAQWLMDKENPLTPRVRVNQIWLNVFGRGLVPTLEDFGSQGEPPAHPELLDWLASEYLRLGWDTKALVKLIVTSAAYRQASEVTPEKLEKDPYNALLSRGARYRVRGETVRDIALAASGLLSPRIGGPSVFPPQPSSVLDDQFIEGGFKVWPISKGGDLYRRGLYTFYKRTSVYPTFMTFDAPDRTVCTVKRPRSNTPLQALTLLNDTFFVEAAGNLAKRILTEIPGDSRDRVRYGYRLVLSRTPTEKETAGLLALLEKVSMKYKADVVAARKSVSSAFPVPAPQVDATVLAPWIMVANVLLNLDETITRE